MRIVDIDLSRRHIAIQSLPEDIIEDFFGGRGINTKLLFDLSKGLIDPLSPHYPIFFGTGPLTSSPFPMGGRFIATAKSPLTETIFTSSCGGRMGVMMKKIGIDFISIRGRADTVSYILFDGENVEIRGAEDIWGKGKDLVKKLLKERHGNDVSILLIGKAGEKGVLYANIENDGRFFGRGGLGAILGSKNLKAVVLKAKKRLKKNEKLRFLKYEWEKLLTANPVTSQALPLFGTGILLNYMREMGLLPAKNFREKASLSSCAISGEEITRRMLKKKKACMFCPVACGRITQFGEGPEYETLWSLGSNLLLHDPEKVAQLNRLCNEYGIDTITTGNVIAYAIELSEKGKISLETTYGDFEGIKSLIQSIGEKKGLGEMLSLGTKKMAEILGDEDPPQVKGLELPAYDPRGAYGQALSFATSNRGGCHLQAYLIAPEVLGIPKLIERFSTEGKGNLVALYQNLSTFMDTLILCRFSLFAIPSEYYARIASCLKDKRLTMEDVLKIGERIWNLERLFNIREGVKGDVLPKRFMSSIPLKDMLREYYEARDWDDEGIPKESKLKELGL